MLRATRVSIAFVLGLLPLLATAQERRQHAHELSARSITLPPSDPGLLTALPCSTCASLTVNTNSATVYQIKTEVVTLAEMRRQFAQYPFAHVLVVLGDDFTTVRMVKITGGLDQ